MQPKDYENIERFIRLDDASEACTNGVVTLALYPASPAPKMALLDSNGDCWAMLIENGVLKLRKLESKSGVRRLNWTAPEQGD